MDGVDRGRKWANFKQRLGFKGMGCCGASSWSSNPSALTLTEEDAPAVARRSSPVAGMNLAMALAAERDLRGDDVGPNGGGDVKSLMRLFEEMDGVDWKMIKRKEKEKNGDCDWMCCVCMERSKGAAFIPCGHTFCRVCSRELWLNRATCPVCNRSIIEILDIY